MKKVVASIGILSIFALVIISGLRSNVIAAGEVREIARWTNLYDAPGGNPLAGIVLEPGTQVTELNRTRDGHWVLVQTESGNGWVPATSIAGESNTSNAPPAANPDNNAQITLNGERLPTATCIPLVGLEDELALSNLASSTTNSPVCFFVPCGYGFGSFLTLELVVDRMTNTS